MHISLFGCKDGSCNYHVYACEFVCVIKCIVLLLFAIMHVYVGIYEIISKFRT